MSIQAIGLLLLIGLAAGIFGGMVGLGGGVIMIPALIYFMGMSQLEAQGTSLAVMLPPVGLFAVMNYYKSGQLNFKYALLIAVAFTIGGYFGSKIALSLPLPVVKKIFAFALIIIAIRMIIKS